MPRFEAKTVEAAQVWQSPDGQRTIYEVMLEVQGSKVKAKTYSAAIAKVGFSGELESYEKTGNRGPETYVKQVQKEGFSPGGGGFKGGRPMADPFTMYLSYAKDIVVAHITAQTKEGAKMTLDDSIAATIQYGQMLFEARPDAPGSKPESEPLPPEPHHEPVDSGQIDAKTLNDLFPE